MRSLFGLVTCICILLTLFLVGCHTERTTTMFGFSGGVSDSTTDPERLNRELDDSLRQSELKRMEKLQATPQPEPETGE